MIRKLIFTLKERGVINADHQMALFFAARYLWVEQWVRPRRARGLNIVSDRSFPATAAYQGYAEGGNLTVVERMAEVIFEGCKPDAVLLFDASSEETMKRLRAAGRTEVDPFDRQGIEYFERVIWGYRDMAARQWGGMDWYVINPDLDVSSVSRQVVRCLNHIFDIK